MAGVFQRLCAVSRVSGRSLLASTARKPSLISLARAASTTAPVFPPASDLKVGSTESPPPPGLPDLGLPDDSATDWSKSYSGLSEQAFAKEIADVLLAPLDPMDIEIKPDGLLYLPEIKYRRVLNRAFGPGAWGLAPRSETNVGPRIVSREYALVCHGRLVAIARGEQEYFDPSGIPTATEACKSNALMRCSKDLGIASELWDPRFIREFKAKYCVEIFAEHIPTKKKKKMWRRKDQPKLGYPYQE
ncbi:mitochondrial genome maintenance protein [Mycena crocata]|nr:mitochondrial genome maintenance protein [Mycena crocata]